MKSPYAYEIIQQRALMSSSQKLERKTEVSHLASIDEDKPLFSDSVLENHTQPNT